MDHPRFLSYLLPIALFACVLLAFVPVARKATRFLMRESDPVKKFVSLFLGFWLLVMVAGTVAVVVGMVFFQGR